LGDIVCEGVEMVWRGLLGHGVGGLRTDRCCMGKGIRKTKFLIDIAVIERLMIVYLDTVIIVLNIRILDIFIKI
jgi:hypothetical protein